MDKEKLQDFVAEMLKELRIRHGLSKAAMADILYINPKTWAKYEAGTSSPTLAEFLTIFDELGEDPLRSSLIHFYPETYSMLQSEGGNEELRRAIANYFKNVATDKDVTDWSYLVFGSHGSNLSPQLQEFITIDHLPLKYRYMIAMEVLAFWSLAQVENAIVDDGNNMPNMELFEKGVRKAKQAIDKGLPGYGMALDGDDACG